MLILLNYLSSPVGLSKFDADLAVGLFAKRFKIRFASPSESASDRGHVFVPLPPGLEYRFVKMAVPNGSCNGWIVSRSDAELERLSKDVFRDYVLLLLRTSAQWAVDCWTQLSLGKDDPTVADIVTRFATVRTDSEKTVLKQIAGTVSSMMLGGSRYALSPWLPIASAGAAGLAVRE